MHQLTKEKMAAHTKNIYISINLDIFEKFKLKAFNTKI